MSNTPTRIPAGARIYISGAIAHHDLAERKACFAKACKELLKAGHFPFNPFNNGVADDAPYQTHMRADIAILLACDAIYMLRGWEHSKGCKLELDVASSCGIPVFFEHTDQHLLYKPIHNS